MADNTIPSWEESAPVENNNTIPSWEESAPVENRIFSPTKNNWNLLRKSFAGDPLAFIDDPQVRADLEFATGRFENPDLERKKWALAAYFAQMRKEDIQFCHANIDTLLEQFNGRKVTIDEAWQERQEALGLKGRDKGFWESRPVAAVVAGEGQVAESTFNVLGFLAKLWAFDVAVKTKMDLQRTNPEAAKLIRDPFEAADLAENAVRGVYKKHYAPITAWSQENMALPEDWMTNSDSFSNWCGNAAIATVNYLPQLAAQTGLTVATGGTSSLATVYGINGYYKIKDDHPEMSESEAVIYAVGIGMINGGLEKITLGIIKGNVSKEFAKQGIKKGFLEAAKHFGWASGKEGMQEAAEQFAENLLDIKMGLRGDTKNWKASDYWREMTRGVPESAFLGAVTGAPLATDAYVAKRQIAARQDTMRSMVHDKVQELSAKEDLSPEEAAELEKLKVVDDAGNTADVEKAAQEIYEKEIIRLREEAERDAELTDEERLEQEGREGEENYRLRNEKLPHNPQETIDTANKLMEQFPDIDLDVVYSPEDLPADVQARIAEDDLDVSRVRAWVDDSNTVHLIASNVRPSEVARTLGHEIIGHKGLRTVFGENFDSLLDQVYKDHFEEVSLLAQRYHRDIETTENQRYLTEEFLADCANAETKPSWWKEFLGFVRQQLRKILPNMRFTDADIESALSRSARAMRKRNKKAASEFTEADGSGVRFSIRNDAPPKKTMTGYKVFAVFKNKPGQLFPPMVANPGGASTPVGVWLDADAAPRAEDSKTGRMRVQAGGKGTNTGKQTLAYRPGWHLGEIPKADQFNRINPETQQKELFPENFVWAECEFAADVDYQQEAEGYGYNANGKFQHSLAGLPKIPANGFYKYRTNPDPATVPWFITGAMKVKRILSDAEVNAVLQQNGLPPMQRKGGEMNLADYGLSNEEIKFSVAPVVDNPAFKNWFADSKVVDDNGNPLVVYHGTNADFNIFDKEKFGLWDNGSKFRITGTDENGKLKFETLKDEGFFFTAQEGEAKDHAEGAAEMAGGSARIIKAYLKAENPLVIEMDKYYAEVKRYTAQDWYDKHTGEILDQFHAGNYDSIIIKNPLLGTAGNMYIVFEPNQIKSATDNVGTYDPANPDIRFSVGEVWTGSAADYDKPSLQYIGTGEGQQVYGWGLYGSSSREVAEWYANNDAREKNKEQILLDGKPFNYAASGGGFENLVAYDVLLDVKRHRGNVESTLDWYRKGIESRSSLADDYKENIAWLEKNKDRLKYVASKAPEGNRHIYRQTFWDGRVENLLDWDEEVPITLLLNLNNHLIDGYENGTLGNGIGEDVQYKTVMLMYNSMSGGELYNILSKGLGSPKAASEFLYSAGVDGITYVGDSSGARNYVAFSDKDIRVDEHIRFAVAPEDENLIVMHNVTAAKLRKAAKLGGLPVPSLAIVDAEKSDFDNFGEISLVADKALIDPKIKSNKVYNADIYSPRAPEIIYEYTQSDFDRAYEKIKPFETLDPEDRNSLDKTLYYFENGMTDRDFADALKSLPATQKWYSNTNNEDLDFDTWWESVALPELNFSQNGKIFNGYTPSGKRKWLPANLENIVKLMTKKVRNGEGFNYGIGNIRSMKAKQFKSIADIKKSRNNIVSEETFKQIKKDIQEEYQQLEEDMRRASSDNGYSWGWDTGSDSLLAMAEGGRDNIQYLEDRFGDDPEILDKMAAFLDKLVNMPAEYFEAKPQRAVGFDEFKAAVVPEDLPADVRKILEDAGLEIYTYGKTPRKAALQMATMDNELRFSLTEYSEDDQRDIVKILKPFTGQYAELKEEEYAAYLEKHGVKIPVKDAWYFALEACRENQKDARARGIQRRNDWLYDNFPLYREVVDFTGSTDFVIKPAHRFHGEAFTGAWISPEFRKYSEKRSRRKKESDAQYRKYIDKREKALANADGMSSDELAEAIARKWGRDSLDVEQEIIDFFRDLSKKEFYHNYTAWREENVFADKEAQKAAMEEWMKQEQAKIEDEVVEILQKGQVVTEKWVWDNRKVYQELYRQMFDGKEAPYSPGKKDLEAINAALMQEGANASTYAQAYKVAREAAWAEYQAKYHALQEKVLQSKADAVSLQREALRFAEENLPAEYRSEFVRSVVSLLDYSTSPSNKYPEGRRMHEFRNIQSRIIRRAAEVRKDNGILAIREMLDSAKIKRNYKGIPTSVLPSEQGRVDRIRQAINMNLATVTNAIEYNNQKIMELEGNEEVEDLMDNFLEDNRLLEMFGNLENRSADDVDAAAKMLENIIKGGKAEFKDAITKRKAEVDAMRKRAVDDATFGKNEYKDRGDAQKHSNYWLKNESLGTLLRIVSGKSIQDFDNSVAGELYRKVEDSTQKEQTSLRHMQEDLDAALRDIAGVTGNRLQVLRKKGKFFRMVSEVVEHTGVFKTEYSRPIKTGKVDFVFEHGRRGLLKRAIPVEDYEWYGKMRPGARSILQKIDNGEKVALWQDVILDDAAIAFLKQQLADFDAGLKQSYEVFNNESDDANFNRMIEEERQGGKLIVFSHDPNETSSTVEVPLSQGAALQILLTWEQEHYQPNMKWNGWTEKSIEQLKKFIKPEVLQMGYWMRDQIAKNKAALDAKVFERYGAHLPLNENYFPAAFRGGKTKSVQVDSELGRGAGSMSINPNFLIARKFHLKPVDTDADAFTSFLSNQLDQGHFLAWSDAVRDLKAVYGGTMVQKSIADNFGKAVVSNLVERVATIARGGGEFSNDYAARLLAKLYRHWVPAKIAINGSSFIKQLLGTAAYMNHVPVKDFVYYFGKTLNFSNPDYREFVKWAKNTDYMKNRMGGGLDKDLSYLLNYTRDSKAYSPLSDALLDGGTYLTRRADAWSAMHGGYAAYMYALDQARKSGYSEGEAREAARRAWMRATDETQQSGYLKDQNYFQSNQGAFRYLTAFMTNPIQTMNLQLQTINEIRYGSDKKAAWRKLVRQIFVNHLVVPTLMQFTTDMLRYGFDVADWWEEAEFEDYFLAWMLGSFESVFLTGKLVKSIGDYTLDRMIGRKMSFADSISALPLADDLKRDAGLLVKIADGEKELTETELMDAVKALGDVGMAIGAFKPEYGAVGAIIHAVGAQGKRIVRWFEDKK